MASRSADHAGSTDSGRRRRHDPEPGRRPGAGVRRCPATHRHRRRTGDRHGLCRAPRQPVAARRLEAVVAGARSAGEALFRDLLRRAGLPEPAWNAAVDTASGRFRVDALWRSAGLAVEIDGARWHLDAASWERDLARANALQATGVRLLRFSVRQLTQDPRAVIDAVRSALAHCAAS